MGSSQALTSYPKRNAQFPEVGLPAPSHPVSITPAEPAAWQSLWSHVASASRPVHREAAFAPRCSEKGCVFPASSDGLGRCVQHDRQNREPVLFSSLQPTRMVLDRAKFGVSEIEVDTSRAQDRRKLAGIRQAFLED